MAVFFLKVCLALIHLCAPHVVLQAAVPVAVNDVQPTVRDVVHTVWPNGPSSQANLGRGYPVFGGSTAAKADPVCTKLDDLFTGYDKDGTYCMESSSDLNDNPHLLMYSGHLGILVDLAGIRSTTALRNLLPKLGSTSTFADDVSPATVYQSLDEVLTNITLSMSCVDGSNPSYFLGSKGDQAQAAISLVRQGKIMTQVTIHGLEWQHYSTFKSIGECANFVKQQDPDNQNCKHDFGGSAHPCTNAAYPICENFVEGQRWGKCHSKCDHDAPELWMELSMWGDSISLVLAWAGAPPFPTGCTGNASISISGMASTSGPVSRTTAVTGAGTLPLLLVAKGSTIVTDADPSAAANQVTVTSATPGVNILSRTATRDVFVEVPTTTPKCQYNYDTCSSIGLIEVPVTVTNPHPTDVRTLRLSFSRNFPSGVKLTSRTGAEITGLTAQIWDAVLKQPSGIPVQMSKNWHTGSTEGYWAGFDGYWWTANSFLRLPANSSIYISLALNYEWYGGISAFSHAQLSIVGYSSKWLWEEAALGSSGENICLDPLGSHTQATITDVRPKLYDGEWKQNVGGGNFLPHLFTKEASGSAALQYIKSLDPQLHSNGPCLSNASYTGVSRDGSIATRVEFSGTRTNDLVRLFFRIRFDALQSVDFARLFFFQMASETYNYYNLNNEVKFGGRSADVTTVPQRTCTGVTSRKYNSLYNAYGGDWVRTEMNGTAPWWFAFGPNAHEDKYSTTKMVTGDRGLIIRSYKSRLGGIDQTRPSFSLLCDKLELGVPAGLRSLSAGDFLDMELEMLVLPRQGNEFDIARANSGSASLQQIENMTTWERVKADAERGDITVTPLDSQSRVESKYPIRVCSNTPTSVDAYIIFEVQGKPLGLTPITICGLGTHAIPDDGDHGLWLRPVGAANFTLFRQGSTSSSNDYWQTNYDRNSGTYETVFNIELKSASTTVSYGINPNTYVPTSSTPTPPSTLSSLPSNSPTGMSSITTTESEVTASGTPAGFISKSLKAAKVNVGFTAGISLAMLRWAQNGLLRK
eukprot:TRINITY_DN66338_c0_g1_i1.p1 TRINITY_DN66338_c0_g1~~TRINITY_DN66338_c0_g1_i1.p1  ORF type:complete len:1036 (+),score=58.33 TRINITY_DN66338_c0_g1_i1:240-3347(+)